ncbi:MAG: hypothetical protein ACT4QD_22165, partial [Acidobacteriota bacterium]
MLSTRFAPAICVLVGLAIVPTMIHSYAGEVASDGRVTSAIPTTLDNYAGVPTSRSATWGKRRFDSDDWTERTYTRQGDEVRLTIVRSYDPKTLYHHPELAVAYGTSFVGLETRHMPQ